MIRFHYRTVAEEHRVGLRSLRPGTRLCEVYSTESLEELLAWGRRYGFRPTVMHYGAIPHWDCWGRMLAILREEITEGRDRIAADAAFQADVELWQRQRQAERQSVPCCLVPEGG